MAHLTVDLMSRDSLVAAQAVIEQRLAEINAAPQGSDESPELPDDYAEQVARNLWRRVGGPTRELIGAFAQADEPITLSEVAEALGEDYSTIKARKFRFGRTENAI